MAGIGGFAGGLVRGMESAERANIQREQIGIQRARDARDSELHGFRVSEAQSKQDRLKREDSAWDEVAQITQAEIRRMQGGAAPPQAAVPASAVPAAGPIDQGGGTQTMPLQDDGAGIPTRALPDTAGAAPGFMPSQTDTAPAGLDRRAPQPSQATQAGPGNPREAAGVALLSHSSLFRSPDYLNKVADVFVRNKIPEGIKWLERAHVAEKENGIEAMMALAAGDPQRAIQAFNANGRDRITNAQPIIDGEHKGKWALTFQGAPQPVVIDPREVVKSFLPPKDYLGVLDKEHEGKRKDAESGALVAERGAKTRALDAQAAAIQANAASLGEYRQRMGGAAETRAGRAGAPSAAMSTTRSAQVSREVERALTTSDGDGKGVLDRERAPFYKSIAAQLARQDPELTASEAADIAMSVPHITPKMAAEQAAEELRDLRKDVGVGDKAAGIFSGGGFKQAHGQTEEEWTKDRIKEIVRNAEAEADARLAELGVTRRRGDGSPAKPKVTQEAIAALRANPGRADDFRAMFGVDPAQYLTQSGARQTGATAASPPASEGAGLTRRSATAAPAQPLGEGLTRRGEQVFRREGANEVLDKKSTIDADPRVSFLRSDIAKAIEAKDMAKVGVLTKALNEYVSNKYGGWQ